LLAVDQTEPGRMTIDLGETVPMAPAPAPPATPGRHEIADRMLAVAAGVKTVLVDPASGEPLFTLVDPEDPAGYEAGAFARSGEELSASGLQFGVV
jgi:hypothetical protein